MKFSYFNAPITNKIPSNEVTTEDIYTLITSTELKERTDRLRSGETQIKTNSLPFVTFACKCTKRDTKHVKNLSGYIGLDFDKVSDIEGLKSEIIGSLSPELLFVSPSGNGLKVVYQIDLNAGDHSQYFKAFVNYFSSMHPLDKSGCDVVRSCFLCHDENAFYDELAETIGFDFLEKYATVEVAYDSFNVTVQSSVDEINRAKHWLDNEGIMFEVGSRNKYITELAAFCNRVGVPKEDALNDALEYEQTGFTATEIRATVESIYRNTDLHGINKLTTPTVDFSDEVSFPVSCFPLDFQNLITDYCEVYSAQPDFIGGAILTAVALAIGDKMELHTRYKNLPVLWFAFVGDVSAGKTDPLAQCLSFFRHRDMSSYDKYKLLQDEFEAEQSKPKKDQVRKEKPTYFQYVINDATPETLPDILNANKRGTIIYRDELKGWFDDFGRYAKSGEQSTMLSTYFSLPITINRKGAGVTQVARPVLFVAGGIQPDLLPTLAQDNRDDSGFLARFCFLYPDVQRKPYYSNKALPRAAWRCLESCIDRLTGLQSCLNLTLSVEAMRLYENWFNANADKSNNERSSYLKGVYGKLDIIALRVAIVLHGMQTNAETNAESEVQADTMGHALELTEYFRVTAIKVHNRIVCQKSKTEITDKDVANHLKNKGFSLGDIQAALKLKHRSNVQRLLS